MLRPTGSTARDSECDFIEPIKLVKNIDDMQKWENSEAYHEYLGFICTLNDAIKGKNNEQGSVDASEEINKICDLLNTLDTYIDETPPIKQPQRFGNQAFRQWYAKLKTESSNLLKVLLPPNLHPAITEIQVYLVEGFGNNTRIDYGTGHELSFLMFLCALFKINFLKVSDGPATACKVFVRYLEVVRKLQMTYNMEPAGSHGVWSLDDFQFVPFIWGSSQFTGNLQFEPTCFLRENIIKKYSSQNMFLSCIEYINKVKTGPFAEHSNQLWSISGVSTWSKINSGLIKMYKAEVLAKFPLVQHIYFGSLFNLNPFKPPAKEKPKTSFDAIHRPLLTEQCPSNLRTSPGVSIGVGSCNSDEGKFTYKSSRDSHASVGFNLGSETASAKNDSRQSEDVKISSDVEKAGGVSKPIVDFAPTADDKPKKSEDASKYENN